MVVAEGRDYSAVEEVVEGAHWLKVLCDILRPDLRSSFRRTCNTMRIHLGVE